MQLIHWRWTPGQQHWLMPDWGLSVTCIFSTRHITSLLCIWTADSTSVLWGKGSLLYSKTSNRKKRRNAKTMVFSRQGNILAHNLVGPPPGRWLLSDSDFSLPCQRVTWKSWGNQGYTEEATLRLVFTSSDLFWNYLRVPVSFLLPARVLHTP